MSPLHRSIHTFVQSQIRHCPSGRVQPRFSCLVTKHTCLHHIVRPPCQPR
ncbi:hypothetical protein G647_02840 [Cladophialophora carrionii CBS 160.54]|uniref:Uncharacterized protein n=1 Tax=Cladophialophora carrionii CBS 160.54 TaxID=1279043 RepID=V9DIB7_9EURO|nr:uncharacterized protein G647_02840 [Cladophialophora carrionii CBS 160.54]ETI26063.1 hypothetical protein G647_02840 [Cladophialophora carrionii CBS 160.54]